MSNEMIVYVLLGVAVGMLQLAVWSRTANEQEAPMVFVAGFSAVGGVFWPITLVLIVFYVIGTKLRKQSDEAAKKAQRELAELRQDRRDLHEKIRKLEEQLDNERAGRKYR